MVDGRKSAEELVGDIGENGGTTGGDAILDNKAEEFGQKLIDGNGGAKLGKLGEGGGKVGIGGDGVAHGGVPEAESGVFQDGEATAASGGGTVMTKM